MTTETTAASTWKRWVPIAHWLPAYDTRWLRPDLIAGLTVWALLVPEAMAYADIASGTSNAHTVNPAIRSGRSHRVS